MKAHRQTAPESQNLPSRLLSADLSHLAARFSDRPARLGALLTATKDRGPYFFLMVLAMPFVTPIPLPGFSLPFGGVVALVGTMLALGRKPWLPERLLRRELPAATLSKWLLAASRLTGRVESLLRPRLVFISTRAGFRRLADAQIAWAGVMLALPLPLPFSNSLPAWTVLLHSAGALGRDGVFSLVGCAAFILTVAYFCTVAWGASGLIDPIIHFLGIR